MIFCDTPNFFKDILLNQDVHLVMYKNRLLKFSTQICSVIHHTSSTPFLSKNFALIFSQKMKRDENF